MSRLRDPTVFRFCAIPQVMAIATLVACYNNPRVLTSVVKIRKGEAVALMVEAGTMPALYAIFDRYLTSLRAAVPHGDPSRDVTIAQLDAIDALLASARVTGTYAPEPASTRAGIVAAFASGVAVGLLLRPHMPALSHALQSVLRRS